MSERKVLNKYYPPEFDPSKIPKLGLPRNRTYSIRIMAPFNMRCSTCGEYIYKGKKFNSRKETVEDEDYLGLRIFRFYIKCPRCVAEIAFKTDPENTDYALEAGATRNFEALRTAELQAEREYKAKEEEEKNNPMKVLEKRTQASRQEMDMIETLEDLKQLNSRHAKVDFESMVDKYRVYEEQLRKLQDEEDEQFIQSIFGKGGAGVVRRIEDDDDEETVPNKKSKPEKPTDILSEGSTSTSTSSASKAKKQEAFGIKPKNSLGTSKAKLSQLVKRKPATSATEKQKDKTGENSSAVKPDVSEASGGKSNDKLSTLSTETESKTRGTLNSVSILSGTPGKDASPDAGETSLPGVQDLKKSTKSSAEVSKDSAKPAAASEVSKPASSALGLLGSCYSDSESDNSD